MATKEFSWKMPSMTLSAKEIICNGYIREHYDNYMIYPLIKLIAEFYTNDKHVIDDIKNAHHLQRFSSEIFSIQSFKFYLEFYPNGSNDNNIGTCILYLCLAILPPQILSIETNYKLILLETLTEFSDRYAFTKDESYDGWPRSSLTLKSIQNLKSITFNIEMPIIYKHSNKGTLKIYDETKLNKPQQLNLKISRYKWEINDLFNINWLKNVKIGQFMNGPIMTFGPFKMYLQFCPRGRHDKDNERVWIGISIWYWPPNLSKSLMDCKLEFKEIGCCKTTHKVFSKQSLCLGWCAPIIHNELKILNTFTLTADISIIDIFDINGNNYNIQKNEDFNYNNNIEKVLYIWYKRISKKSEMKIIKLIKNYTIVKDIHDFKILTNCPKSSYIWNIDKFHNIKNIHKCSNLYGFESKVFEIFDMKWYIGFWPNGSRVSRKGTVNIFLNLISFKSKNTQVSIKFVIQWIEANNSKSVIYDTFIITANGGGETCWSLKTIDIKILKCFTIKLELELIDIIENNKIITQKYVGNNNGIMKVKLIDTIYDIFEWRILPNILIEKWESDIFKMFGMEWCMKFYLNGNDGKGDGWTDLCLNILKLPNSKCIICVRYTIYIKECNIKYVACATFYKGVLVKPWGKDRLSAERFKALTKCSIHLKMELIDVFDNKMNVTSSFV